ncbi:HAD family phosphatase [Candidatus Woesearchaeota archaeon]|nr:HAD family phosphatase [Candidatus Woesearchaeota archaeon]
MIRAIIWDMDGVVIDTNHLLYERWSYVLKKWFQVKITKQEFAHNLGESAIVFSKAFIQNHNLDVPPEELLGIVRKNEPEFNLKIRLKPGIREFLKEHKNKFKFALATGAEYDRAVLILRQLNILDLFDFIIGGDQVQNSKPDPEIFLRAAEQLNAEPGECIVVEDAQHGLNAAQKAGMKCIIILDEFTKHHNFKKADLILNGITELNLEKIKQLGE